MKRISIYMLLYQRIQRYYINFLLSPVFFMSLLSCESDQLIKDLRIDTDNALRVIIDFTTSKESISIINYWESDHIDQVFTKKSDLSRQHHITLHNLKPDTEYNFIIKTSFSNKSVLSDTSYFRTSMYPLPKPRFTLMVDNGKVFSGYILLRNVEYPSQQIILDNKGQSYCETNSIILHSLQTQQSYAKQSTNGKLT